MEKSARTKKIIGLTTTKETNFLDWYRQILIKSEMVDYTYISGCYVLRPNSYCLWEEIQKVIDAKIKDMGVKNAYFPLFITKGSLEKEKTHIKGFSPEVAWVTQKGNPAAGIPLAIRPTSETSIYPHFSNWIKSYRDLPLKINQWCNVVRWELKDCIMFIRSREFLWQEGHTCYPTKKEADTEVNSILKLYAYIYQEMLSVPVIQGRKSEKGKIAGADYSTTVECFIPTIGKAIQGATSHCLGQNFSKMFNIQFETSSGEKQYVYQNSWKITTKTIGIMTMLHSDNKGLVLPPRLAITKVVIIPCGLNSKATSVEKQNVMDICNHIKFVLTENGFPTECDERNNYSVGYKFNYWEMRGIPLRIEIGPKDINTNFLQVYRRDTCAKTMIPYNRDNDEDLVKEIYQLLETMQSDMFTRAYNERNEHIKVCNDIQTYIDCITDDPKNMFLAPWCEMENCETDFIEQNKNQDFNVKSLCIPFDQTLASKISGNSEDMILCDTKCFWCENNAKSYALFGSSY